MRKGFDMKTKNGLLAALILSTNVGGLRDDGHARQHDIQHLSRLGEGPADVVRRVRRYVHLLSGRHQDDVFAGVRLPEFRELQGCHAIELFVSSTAVLAGEGNPCPRPPACRR